MNWDRSQHQFDNNPTLKKFERWMKDRGYRDASIDGYLKAIRAYLGTLKIISPSIEDAKENHSNMAASNLARATVNNRRAGRSGLLSKFPGLMAKKVNGEDSFELPAFDNVCVGSIVSLKQEAYNISVNHLTSISQVKCL